MSPFFYPYFIISGGTDLKRDTFRNFGSMYGGERGIRTLGRAFAPHSLSRRAPSASSAISPFIKMAEGVGFEPTELSLNGFQDRRLKPLGHPSTKNVLIPFYKIQVNIFYCIGNYKIMLFLFVH